jgi:hypothetical protein
MRARTFLAGHRRKRLGAWLALGSGSILAAWALFPVAAASADPGPATTVVNSATGNCLDSNYLQQIYDIPCNGGNYQNWITYGLLTPDGQEAYVIQDAQTGFCLDGNDEGAVYTYDCINGDTYQEWIPDSQGGTLAFVSDQTGRALQADPWIDADNPDGTTQQRWGVTVLAELPAISIVTPRD